MADTLTEDIGSDRAAFATLSALVSRDPHVTGDPAEYNCFTRICESCISCNIFINCAVVNVIFSQRNQTGNMSLTARESVFL